LAGFLFVHIADHLQRRAVGTELIRDKVLALSGNVAASVGLGCYARWGTHGIVIF